MILSARSRCALAFLGSIVLAVACSPSGGPFPSSSLSPSASPTASLVSTSARAASAVPDSPEPAATLTDPAAFAPPTPVCPSPPDPVSVPNITASVGSGPRIVATRGSSTFTTCTTTSTVDAAPSDPTDGLLAHAGDRMTLTLSNGWRFLQWEGYDRPAVGEGANVWLPTDTPGRPEHVDVPVPIRLGDSIAGFSIWLVEIDDRVVGQLEILVRIKVS